MKRQKSGQFVKMCQKISIFQEIDNRIWMHLAASLSVDISPLNFTNHLYDQTNSNLLAFIVSPIYKQPTTLSASLNPFSAFALWKKNPHTLSISQSKLKDPCVTFYCENNGIWTNEIYFMCEWKKANFIMYLIILLWTLIRWLVVSFVKKVEWIVTTQHGTKTNQ